jgi:hypothetical protein
MSRLTSSQQDLLSRSLDRGRSEVGRDTRGPSGLVLAGLLAFGAAAVLCYLVAPDVRRYMKIRNM